MGGPRNDSRGRGRSPPRYRSRSRDGGKGKGGPPAQGRHKITVEFLPDDMSWQELKDLAIDRGPSITFSRTFQYKNSNCGMLEFQYREDAEAVTRELDNRRIEGSRERLRVSYGDLSLEPGARRYPGKGSYDDRRRDDDRGGRRDDDDRRRRSPSRRNNRGDDDDGPIMTLYLMGLPDDAREKEITDDLDAYEPSRVVVMNKGPGLSAFVRFASVQDAERAMDHINSGRAKICGRTARADMARRNTKP